MDSRCVTCAADHFIDPMTSLCARCPDPAMRTTVASAKDAADADDDEGERGKRAWIPGPREAILDEVMREAPTDATRMAIVDAIGPYRLEATQYMDDGTHLTSHGEEAFRGAEALTVSQNESQEEVRPGRGKMAITAFGYAQAERAALSSGDGTTADVFQPLQCEACVLT